MVADCRVTQVVDIRKGVHCMVRNLFFPKRSSGALRAAIPSAVDRCRLECRAALRSHYLNGLEGLVQVVGGERVQVESLAPPPARSPRSGVKTSQLSKIKRASLLVRIGLDHEPWLGRALRTLSDRRFVRDSPNYLDTSKGIQLLQAETPRIKADKGTCPQLRQYSLLAGSGK